LHTIPAVENTVDCRKSTYRPVRAGNGRRAANSAGARPDLCAYDEAMRGAEEAAAVGVVAMGERSGQTATLPWAYLRLPPFPQVAVRVLQLANNENVQLHQLCDLISSDPAFASEVLTVANSWLYAPRYPSTTILQAVAVLGANTLQGMCVTVGVRAYLGKAMSYPAMRNLWRHNLACAIIAERIAKTGDIDKDIAYTSGILHDIGRMALAVIQPKGYAALLEKHCGEAATMMAAERELFGWDHCQIGRQLIGDWKLPESFEAVVAEHHEALRTDGVWDLAELVKASCAMASALGFAAFPGCETSAYSDLIDELPARERELFHPDAETLKGEVAESIQAIESV
jgi:putative nucleotidyltransferase with HDIG domain